jgi:hypothetical protein
MGRKKVDSFSAEERNNPECRGKEPLLRECVRWFRLRRDRYVHIGNDFCTRFSANISARPFSTDRSPRSQFSEMVRFGNDEERFGIG